jgi:endonuclease YncB( thermonuclease family)
MCFLKKMLKKLKMSQTDSTENEKDSTDSLNEERVPIKVLTKRTKNKLISLKHKEVSKFSFEGLCRFAKVTKVIDGDTFWVAFPYPKSTSQRMIRVCVRLDGIDTAERRSKDEEEKALAQKAKERAQQIIDANDQLVYVEFGEADKYGRCLSAVYGLEQSANSKLKPMEMPINQILLDERLAIRYGGGKKRMVRKVLEEEENK